MHIENESNKADFILEWSQRNLNTNNIRLVSLTGLLETLYLEKNNGFLKMIFDFLFNKDFPLYENVKKRKP